MRNSATEDIITQLLPVLRLGNIFLPKGKQNPLTQQEFQVLAFICSIAEQLQAYITPRGIALLLAIDQTCVPRILGSLENYGLITRRYDTTLRKTVVIPTEQGTKLFQEERTKQVRNLHTLIQRFCPSGQKEELERILRELLEKMTEKVRRGLSQTERVYDRHYTK